MNKITYQTNRLALKNEDACSPLTPESSANLTLGLCQGCPLQRQKTWRDLLLLAQSCNTCHVIAALPRGIEKIFARADSGFYCWQAVEAYQKAQGRFIMVARKTSRLLERLQTADWKPSPKTDADQQCEFRYQPEGWGQAYRFIALRYKKKEKSPQEREQYQLFDTPSAISVARVSAENR
jgi:hypothetical protein